MYIFAQIFSKQMKYLWTKAKSTLLIDKNNPKHVIKNHRKSFKPKHKKKDCVHKLKRKIEIEVEN